MAPTPHANDENTLNGSGGSSSSSSYGGGGGSLDNLSKLPDSNTNRHQQQYYRPTSPSAPSSVEEAIRAVDSLLASDDDDDDNDATTVYTSSSDVSEDSSIDSSTDMIGSSLLHHMSLLPTFNSKGNFTSYEKRQLKQEIEERSNNNTQRLESSPYGFHFDKHKAAKKSRLGSSSIIDQPLELNTKQSTAMNEFLDNPDSQSWDDLVASMKKERKKKKTKKKKKKRSSSRHLTVGGSSPRRKTRDGLLAGLPVVDETSVMSDEDYGCGLPNTVFEEDEDDEDEYDEENNGRGSGRAEEETVDFTTPSDEQTTDGQEGQEMSVSSSGYSPDDYHDEEYGDLEEIDFHPPTCRSPTFNYSDGHHSLPPTRPCDDAICIVQKKKKRTKKKSYRNKRGIIKKCAISITLLILLAGIVGGVMIAFRNRTIAVNPESDSSSSNSATAAAVVEESSEDASSYYQGPKGHNVHQDTAPSVDDEEEEEPWSSSSSSSNSSSSHSTGPKGFTVDSKGKVHIKPTALSTIKSIKPTSTNGGETLISVSDNGDTHISFLRFDISTSDDNERIISKATLHLHMTTHEKNIENDATITLEELPNAGIWDEELISWDNPVQTNGSYVVSTFDIKTLSDGGSKEHTEVVLDITKAVVDSNDDDDDDESSVMLKLSTNAHEKIDFASYKFKNGRLVPELVLTLSE